MKPLFSERVQLNEYILKNFLKKVSYGRVSELASDMGLPYGLVYNLVHGRINSLSAENYKLIFGEEPPTQASKKVDGTYFRDLVRLWRYLNYGATVASLYREFYKDKKNKKIDYRIFSGFTKTVDRCLERVMEEKYLAQGFNRSEIEEMINEFTKIEYEKRVFYKKIKPILDYLETNLRVHPSRILNQVAIRYEYGELKTVPKKVYDHALMLKKRTKDAIRTGSKYEIERIREEIYGGKVGFTLFSEIEEELNFLKKYGREGIKKYLGRSISYYKKSTMKRIASWRAEKIKRTCNEMINNQPELALLTLPKYHLRIRIKRLLTVLKSYLIAKIITGGDEIENHILMSERYRNKEYQTEKHGFISMEKAAYFLGMSKIAFDMLVAAHSEIFRRIGHYNKGWYLPYLYLKKIREKKEFDLIKAKYEILANDYEKSYRRGEYIPQNVPVSKDNSPQKMKKAEQQVAMGKGFSGLSSEVCSYLC